MRSHRLVPEAVELNDNDRPWARPNPTLRHTRQPPGNDARHAHRSLGRGAARAVGNERVDEPVQSDLGRPMSATATAHGRRRFRARPTGHGLAWLGLLKPRAPATAQRCGPALRTRKWTGCPVCLENHDQQSSPWTQTLSSHRPTCSTTCCVHVRASHRFSVDQSNDYWARVCGSADDFVDHSTLPPLVVPASQAEFCDQDTIAEKRSYWARNRQQVIDYLVDGIEQHGWGVSDGVLRGPGRIEIDLGRVLRTGPKPAAGMMSQFALP
jgi:hypothetical protein